MKDWSLSFLTVQISRQKFSFHQTKPNQSKIWFQIEKIKIYWIKFVVITFELKKNICCLFLFIFSNIKIFYFSTWRDYKGKMKGIYIGLNLWTSGVDRDLYKFYLMFLSSEIDIKLCQIYTKIYIFDICIKISLNRSYSANTQPIW